MDRAKTLALNGLFSPKEEDLQRACRSSAARAQANGDSPECATAPSPAQPARAMLQAGQRIRRARQMRRLSATGRAARANEALARILPVQMHPVREWLQQAAERTSVTDHHHPKDKQV